jgi:hypothetical protein
LLAAACGGSSSLRVASIGTSTNASATKPSWAATYHCFAAHGYPKYRIINSPSVPSAPPISGWYKLPNGNFAVTPAFQKLYSGAKFEAAEKACMPLVPYKPPPAAVVAARVAQARNFARCARAHGMPNIPDPGNDGSPPAWLIDLKAAGINYDGPRFQHVLATCQKTLKNGLLPFVVGNGG